MLVLIWCFFFFFNALSFFFAVVVAEGSLSVRSVRMGTEPADVIYVVSNAKKADFFYGMCARVFTFASLPCFFFIIIIIILFSWVSLFAYRT